MVLTISHNNIIYNSDYGIKLLWSFNNLFENTIANNGAGINFHESIRNVFKNNSFADNDRLFIYTRFTEFIQDVDNSNQVNGKPIRYIPEYYKSEQTA